MLVGKALSIATVSFTQGHVVRSQIAEWVKLLLYYISFLRILAITFHDNIASNIVLLDGDAGGISKAFIILHKFFANFGYYFSGYHRFKHRAFKW